MSVPSASTLEALCVTGSSSFHSDANDVAPPLLPLHPSLQPLRLFSLLLLWVVLVALAPYWRFLNANTKV